ncbi:MAG: fimbrillin family protein [Bacteroidales bacterium]|nr:fimbrillin family protein [Bacteroidales bacterium]
MKKTYKILLYTAAAAAMAACAKEIEAPAEKALVPKVFTGYADNGVSTKTTLTSDYRVIWNDKDAISVFAGEDNTKFTATNLQDDGRTATFEGLASHSDTYIALYPHNEDARMSGSIITTSLPSVQQAVAGTFMPGANLSVAKTSGDDLYFRNAGAIVGFTVEAEGVTSVTLSSLDGKTMMSGEAAIDASGDTPVMTCTGSASVRLEGTFEAGQKYYFVVAPGEYDGLSLTFANALTEATCTKTANSKVTIERNGNKFLGNFSIAENDWEMPGYRSWTLESKEDVDAFVAAVPEGEKIVVLDLTLKGRGITTTELTALRTRISEVRGTLTFDGIGTDNDSDWLDTNNIIESCNCQGSIIFRNIVNIINPKGFRNTVKVDGDLVFDNCPRLVVDDWILGEGLDVIEEISGNLVLRGLEKLHGFTLRGLKNVGGNFEISGIGGVWRLNNGLAVERIGGDLVLQDNRNLKSLHGFENLLHIGGNVVIFNNAAIPMSNGPVEGEDCIGYCLIKDYMEMGVISPSVAVKLGSTGNEINVDDLQSCNPDAPRSYVINGMAALQAFIDGKGPEKEIVQDLYVTGADITEGGFRSIDDRVSTIWGTLTMESLMTDDGWLSTDQCLENIDIRGSIIMRNIPAHINPNGLRPTKLTGDVILQNCPQFPTDWDPFTTLTEVGGSIRVTDMAKGFGSRFFPAIEKIGGDFIIENVNSFWDFRSTTLREIGGDLVITGCPLFENFLGFHQLTRLGGNVVVIRPAGSGDWLPENDYGTDKVGLCIFKGYKENGVMSPDATITAIGRAGAGQDWEYKVDELQPCGQGFSE